MCGYARAVCGGDGVGGEPQVTQVRARVSVEAGKCGYVLVRVFGHNIIGSHREREYISGLSFILATTRPVCVTVYQLDPLFALLLKFLLPLTAVLWALPTNVISSNCLCMDSP